MFEVKAWAFVWNQSLDTCFKSRLRCLIFQIKAETLVSNQELDACLKPKLGHLFEIKAKTFNVWNQGWESLSEIKAKKKINIWNQGWDTCLKFRHLFEIKV